jgi:predicted RNA-binding Zn-ribbon protein involved in translation (DUF1610 family)
MRVCARCGREIEIKERISRSSTCPSCGAWLHSCNNCVFYSPGMHNDCKESQAEYVSDKRAANFCGYFKYRESAQGSMEKKDADSRSARDRFNKLFGD